LFCLVKLKARGLRIRLSLTIRQENYCQINQSRILIR
jgi:hypothetical protein